LVPVLVALQALLAQHAFADSADLKGQPAAQAYHNIQVLKQLPAGQLLPTMFFMRASLGVSCTHCHVDFEHFESDANRVKQKAREMMRMVEALNRELFEGERRVTCNTCHRGQPRPSAPLPFASIAASPAARAQAGPLPVTTPPSVDQVFDAYVRATGGLAAQRRLTTSRLTGSRVASEGWTAPLEIQLRAPDNIRVAFALDGSWVRAFDGTTGWSQDNHGLHDLRPSELVLLRREAAFYRPHQLKSQYRELKVQDPRASGAADRVVVEGVLSDGRAECLEFDGTTGLLVRITAQADTAFGPLPEQIDLEDYTENGGVTLPATISHMKPDFSYVDRVREVRHGLPADATAFARPPHRSLR
jgi:hypothetical protein